MHYHQRIAELKKAGFISKTESEELEKEADAAADIARTLASQPLQAQLVKEAAFNIGDIMKWIGKNKFEISLGLGAIPALATGGELLKNQIDRKRMYNKMLEEYPQLKNQYSDRELRKAYSVVADYMPNLLKNDAVLAGTVKRIVGSGIGEEGAPPESVSSMVSDANMIGSGTSLYNRNTAPKIKKMIGESMIGTSYPIEMQSQEILGKYKQYKQVAESMESQIKAMDKAINDENTPDIQKQLLENEKQNILAQVIPIKQVLQEIEQTGASAQAEAQINVAKKMRELGRNISPGNVFGQSPPQNPGQIGNLRQH